MSDACARTPGAFREGAAPKAPKCCSIIGAMLAMSAGEGIA